MSKFIAQFCPVRKACFRKKFIPKNLSYFKIPTQFFFYLGKFLFKKGSKTEKSK